MYTILYIFCIARKQDFANFFLSKYFKQFLRYFENMKQKTNKQLFHTQLQKYTTLQKKKNIFPYHKVYFMIFQFIVHQNKRKVPIFSIQFAFVVVIIIIIPIT